MKPSTTSSAGKPGARPVAIAPERRRTILEELLGGGTLKGIARKHGISLTTIKRWRAQAVETEKVRRQIAKKGERAAQIMHDEPARAPLVAAPPPPPPRTPDLEAAKRAAQIPPPTTAAPIEGQALPTAKEVVAIAEYAIAVPAWGMAVIVGLPRDHPVAVRSQTLSVDERAFLEKFADPVARRWPKILALLEAIAPYIFLVGLCAMSAKHTGEVMRAARELKNAAKESPQDEKKP